MRPSQQRVRMLPSNIKPSRFSIVYSLGNKHKVRITWPYGAAGHRKRLIGEM